MNIVLTFGLALQGVAPGVKGTLETWALKEANNRGPQPLASDFGVFDDVK